MTDFRTERDSMGEVRLPAQAYYGAQTQRAVENFPISGRTLPPELIHALGLVKWAAASANRDLGRLAENGESDPLDDLQIDALLAACREVADGKLDDQFPVDVFQTGSGTSSNMNANEVIANRAIELSGGDRFGPEKPIHPNDHVNLGQSTNDIFPTAIHVAVATAIHERLMPALQRCGEALADKAAAVDKILKIGRTHLADATPLTLGQEIGGLARQLERSARPGRAWRSRRCSSCPSAARPWARASTPIPSSAAACANCWPAKPASLSPRRPTTSRPTPSATGWSSATASCAPSPPRCSTWPTTSAGWPPARAAVSTKSSCPTASRAVRSCRARSIPVLCESVMQVAARVLGNDQTITLCGAAGGQFQLNVMMPVMGDAALESVRLLANATEAFTDLCLDDMEANPEACAAAVEKSLALATGLNPYIGYDRAAALAKEAFATGKTIRELCREKEHSSRGATRRSPRSLADDPAAINNSLALGRGQG